MQAALKDTETLETEVERQNGNGFANPRSSSSPVNALMPF
jgi:hypothetical protein